MALQEDYKDMCQIDDNFPSPVLSVFILHVYIPDYFHVRYQLVFIQRAAPVPRTDFVQL